MLRRLLTFHVRKNVVCEGHLASMLREGQVQAILRRLTALADGPLDEAGAPLPTTPVLSVPGAGLCEVAPSPSQGSRWLPSQKGLFPDLPQRQRVIRFRTS